MEAGALLLAGLLREDDGVPAAAVVGVSATGAAAAMLLLTSVSNPAHEAMPSLLPSWFIANDSQWSARSLADRENRWHRETPGWRVRRGRGGGRQTNEESRACMSVT